MHSIYIFYIGNLIKKDRYRRRAHTHNAQMVQMYFSPKNQSYEAGKTLIREKRQCSLAGYE